MVMVFTKRQIGKTSPEENQTPLFFISFFEKRQDMDDTNLNYKCVDTLSLYFVKYLSNRKVSTFQENGCKSCTNLGRRKLRVGKIGKI